MQERIIKPDVRLTYLLNKSHEKVKYLNIPLDLYEKCLDVEIKKGGIQFKEIKELVEKESPVQYVLMHADNLEMAYMAIMYMESCYCRKENDCDVNNEEFYAHEDAWEIDENYENEEDEDGENWIESAYRIPIIEMQDLVRELHHDLDYIPLGSFSMCGDRKDGDNPFWLSCTKETIIIHYPNTGFFFKSKELVEMLSYFKNNKRVYLICYSEMFMSLENDWKDEEVTFEEQNEISFDDIIKNDIVLSFVADEISVHLPEKKRNRYYKQILKDFFSEYSIEVSKDFEYDKIVKTVMDMKSINNCELIEKIVKYSLKGKENEQKHSLTNKDFDFIRRFYRNRNEDLCRKRSAAEKMKQDLIGLNEIKEQVYDVVNVMKYNRVRAKMNIMGSKYHNVHVMLGAPGTAKTTVAELMGQMMKEEKLLPHDRFICINGAELKGKYVGHSAPKTKALFDNYDIIVIDEAYSLVDRDGETDSFGREAIAQLIIELEKHSVDKLVIFAGYGGRNVSEKNNKMREFINSNPGIRSRITSVFYFDSYSADEMVDIFYGIAGQQQYTVEKEAVHLLHDFFQSRVHDENFGNGREARSLLETSVLCAAKRVMATKKTRYSNAEMRELTKEDVALAIEKTKLSFWAQNARNNKVIGF